MTTAQHRRGPNRRPRLSRIFAAIATSVALVAAPLLLVAPAQAASSAFTMTGDTENWSYDLGPMTAGAGYTGSVTTTLPYDSSYSDGTGVSGLPAGLTWTVNTSTRTVNISGTPESADPDVSFSVTWGGESSSTVTFSGEVVEGKTPTSTVMLDVPAVTPWGQDLNFGAQVSPSGSALGQVQFTIDGSNFKTPANVGTDSSVYWFTSFGIDDVGFDRVLAAHYLGSTTYAPSDSAGASVFVYGSDTVKGTVQQDGASVASAPVALLDPTGLTVVASTTADSSGNYQFTLTPTTKTDAQKTYLLRATIAGANYYYGSTSNVTNSAAAIQSGPVQWRSTGVLTISATTPPSPPSWTDTTLGSMRLGTAFQDFVAAAGTPTITYALDDGDSLPDGLTLNTATGELSGTPTKVGTYDFTLWANNDYGNISHDFTVTVGDAAAPAIDLTLDFKAGTAITDASSTISANGLKVGSDYTLYMHSTPVLLYTGTIGASGGFTWQVALPANTPAGAHKLILTGIAPDGSTMTAEAWFTLGSNGKVLAISYTGPTTLAFTGADDPALPLGIAVSLLLFGALALVVARRRRTV